MSVGDLTPEDIEMLIESLRYTRRAFEDYTGYPNHDFKQQRLANVDEVTAKLKAIRDHLPADRPLID